MPDPSRAISGYAVLRLGTRGSPLALAQAGEVRERLLAQHRHLAADAIAVVAIKTSGDRSHDQTLAEAGNKGLFTKEIEDALIAGAVDAAVHSLKDMPTRLPAGLAIACVPTREDPRDALIAPQATSLAALPRGAVIGTASLRRRALLLHRRPDLDVVNLRGNVETRLRKLAGGEVDATLLALAGLRRLHLDDRVSAVLDPSEMLPAVGQGALGIECRADDARVRELLAPLNHGPSATCVAAERAFLAVLDGSCRTPIAALAELDDAGMLHLRGAIIRPDGSKLVATARRGSAADAEAIGADVGRELKRAGGADFFAAA